MNYLHLILHCAMFIQLAPMYPQCKTPHLTRQRGKASLNHRWFTGWQLSSISNRVEFIKVVGDNGAIADGLAICVEDSVPSRERYKLGRKKEEMEITTCRELVPKMSEKT
jgi:hypothetical protein